MAKKKGVKKKRIILIVALLFVVLFFILPVFFVSAPASNVAVVKVEGAIMGSGSSSPLGGSVASSQEIVRLLKQASEADHIKAVLIEINSPGGSAVASDEIASAILALEKPTVAVIREAGASGGYWIASAADYVIANRMSITGSIGVVSSYLEFSGLLEEYGVTYQQLIAGERKDLGTPFRELTPVEEAIFQKKLDIIHEYFIEAVAENRDLSVEEVRSLATGEFYLGVEAFELGLVDELGARSEASKALQTLAGLETVEYEEFRKEVGLLDILSSVSETFSFSLGQGIGSAFSLDTAGQSYPQLR